MSYTAVRQNFTESLNMQKAFNGFIENMIDTKVTESKETQENTITSVEGKEVVERPLMDEDEFTDYLSKNRPMLSFEGVEKFKSIRRAIRRGLISQSGIIFPKRPFNNRGNTSKRKNAQSREMNERKKMIYGKLKTTTVE